MTLKIGTILVAKESRTLPNGIQTTKNKEYPIKDLSKGNLGLISITINDDNGYKWVVSGEKYINQHFTIKRYTLTDLQEKKIAVKLRNYAEYKRLCEAVGDEEIYEFYFIGDEAYYGINDVPSSIIYLTNRELEGRILLDSIDEIDLGDEGKEEVVNECETDAIYIAKLETEISRLDEAIARLKGENEGLREENNVLSGKNATLASNYFEAYQQLQLKESTSTDLTKRERMAWEIWLQGRYTVEQAIEKVNHFLEESKEVKP